MRSLIAAFCLVIFVCLQGLLAADEHEESVLSDWREVLMYGIDDEVLRVLDEIAAAGETGLTEELTQLLESSYNVEVRKAVLELFEQRGFTGVEDLALSFLANPDEEAKLLVAALGYLSEIESSESLPLFESLIDHDDRLVATAAIDALGKMGSEASVALLLARLDDPDYEEQLKPQLILALGSVGSAAAVDPLVGILENREQERVWRMYALDSLGKIGEERALPAIKAVFSERDALIRAYAASALAQFDPRQSMELLLQGLRDTNWRVRVASAKGLADSRAGDALDILMYKARKDPVKDVRIESIRALGELRIAKGLELLRSFYVSDSQGLDIRSASLKELIEKDLGRRTIEAILEVVDKELPKPLFQGRILELTSRELFQKKDPALEEVFERFLASGNIAVRIFGIRGIATNRFSRLKGEIEGLSKDDPYPSVRKEALAALEKW
jgi:HEAT repeat protein